MSTNRDDPIASLIGFGIAIVVIVACIVIGLQRDHDCTAAGGHSDRIVNPNRPSRTLIVCLNDNGERIRP